MAVVLVTVERRGADELREAQANAKAYSVYGLEGKWLVHDDVWTELHAAVDNALEKLETLDDLATAVMCDHGDIARALAAGIDGAGQEQQPCLPCGHPESAAVTADEGTSYCGECARQEEQP